MMNLENRKLVYKNFPLTKDKNNLSQIVLMYDLSEKLFLELKQNTINYIIANMKKYYHKDFEWSEDFLERYDDLICKLPNKTPNGIMKPKAETHEEYTSLVKTFNLILKSFGIQKEISKTTFPNIRYKNSKESEEIKKRPYYTGKLHSDAWVGHIGDSVFIIGVLGDIENNTVEFYEPIDIDPNYLDPADSFEEGQKRYKNLKYLGKLNTKQLVIMDHACVHRTLTSSTSKPRISIDVAMLIDSEFSHVNHIMENSSTEYSYFDYETFAKIGEESKIDINGSITDSQSSKINLIIDEKNN